MEFRIEPRQVNRFSGAVFAVGLGSLFIMDWVWPGILYLLGAVVMLQGVVQGRGWSSNQGAFWLFGFGLLCSIRLNESSFIGIILILIGGGILLRMFLNPATTSQTNDARNTNARAQPYAKPVVDNTLD